ncbi:MAG TPA: aldehyde dehydrogenase family protein [Kouleothrix sp.]|uniref:aldehyde dehydrogenase family protein n=1 Tax=Kouleothrix sp. TaxID=2779161 RepID=UPI002CF81A40|nr:aldehyde dehydrogenase family protein [Kouleothrix sp.]HRC77688.1 aldehyde dehydrogenase family protein [Kouleothrix sp.]
MTDTPEYRFVLAGERRTGTPYTVACPYDGSVVATVHRAGPADLEAATQAAVRAFRVTRALPGHRRAAVLRKVSETIVARAEELARTIALEAGKPIKQARVEVGRSATTFATAADEATRFHDEVLHLDALPGGENRPAIVQRFAIGPIAAIAPFNFPLNLVSHKLAPAIAAGCPVVLKPASQTPISALKLAEIILDAGWPAEALSVLPINSRDAAPLVEDDRFKLLTFTGSPAVGWAMKGRAGRKRVTLELGGNAGVIVHSDADLAFAAERCVVGGYSYAGQSCISVQRVFVQQDAYEAFMDAFVPKVRALKVGHPLDEATDLGSVISKDEGERVGDWLAEARAAGAECLVGGAVRDGVVQPTVVVKAGPELRVNSQEIFAPVVTVQTYTTFDEALAAVNNSDFGLQAGVFTRDVKRIFQAYEALEVGGVMVNEVPTWRIDPMPYGGVKHSGFGREGLRYAIEEMTEPRLLVINLS